MNVYIKSLFLSSFIFTLIIFVSTSRAENSELDPNIMIAIKLYKQYQTAQIIPTVLHQDLPYKNIENINTFLNLKQNYLNNLTKNPNLSDEEIQNFLSRKSDYIPSTHPIIIKLASLLTQNTNNDVEKVLNINNFVVWRITHVSSFQETKDKKILTTQKGLMYSCGIGFSINHSKVKSRSKCSFPELLKGMKKEDNLEELFTGYHNCFGYSKLFAAIARAAGFPTQLVQTTMANSAHIWNRIFIDGKWLLVDTTANDYFDNGQYENDSKMRIDYTFFLITDESAAKNVYNPYAKYNVYFLQ